MREHARLAAAGAGEHEHRRERGRDGLALRVVQGIEEVGDVHYRIHRATRIPPAAAIATSTQPNVGTATPSWSMLSISTNRNVTPAATCGTSPAPASNSLQQANHRFFKAVTNAHTY